MAKFEYGRKLRDMLILQVGGIRNLAESMVLAIEDKPGYADVQVLQEMLASATDTLKRMKAAEYPPGALIYKRDLGPQFEQTLAEAEHFLNVLSLLYGPKSTT